MGAANMLPGMIFIHHDRSRDFFSLSDFRSLGKTAFLLKVLGGGQGGTFLKEGSSLAYPYLTTPTARYG